MRPPADSAPWSGRRPGPAGGGTAR